jgi:DNA-binding NarL/FixJ family response regulator
VEVALLPASYGRMPAALAAVDGGTGPALAKMPRLLLVEDDYLVGMELEAGLTEAGFDVIAVVGSASEAIRLAAADRPKLIVMDIGLAGKRDGIDAAIEIYKTTGIRCIFATAYGDGAMQARAKPAAPVAWLPKPYSVEALIAAVCTALGELNR